MAATKIADFAIEPVPGQVFNIPQVFPQWPCNFSGVSNIKVNAIQNNQESGYSVTWTHQGTSYEIKFVKKIP